MPRRPESAEKRTEVECAAPSCSVRFTPKRADQRYHSATCRQRGARARKAADRATEQETKAEKDAEHPLVAATRRELDEAGALETMLGQAAMETVNRAVDRSSAGYSSMIKMLPGQVAAAIAAVKVETPSGGDPEPEPEDDGLPDEVKAARARRDAARAAAGGA